MQAMNDAAFYFGAPEELWRASCAWAGNGYTDQAEWLLEMAAELVDIRDLPTAPDREQLSPPRPFVLELEPRVEAELLPTSMNGTDDIPF